MNKFSSIVRFVFISITILSFISCEKDEATITPPTITFAGGTFISADTTVSPETELVFYIQAGAGDADLKWISVKEINTNTYYIVQRKITGTEYGDSVKIKAPIAQGEYIYEFTIADEKDQEVTESITIEVYRTPGEIVKYLNITFDPQVNNENFFFSCSTGQTYTYEEAFQNQEEIDIIIIKAMYFTSPSSVEVNGGGIHKDTSCINWNNKNTTIFFDESIVNVPTSVFNTIEDDNLFYSFDGMISNYIYSANVYSDVNNRVVGFKTQNNKHGLIHIVETNIGSSINSTYIIFDIIVQK